MTTTNTEIGAFINAQTEDASPDTANDFALTYDTSATAVKKVKLNKFGSGGITSLASASTTQTGGDYSTYSGTFVDVDGTNLKLTITTGARRVLIVVTATVSVANAGNWGAVDVSVDGTRLGLTYGLIGMQFGNANYWSNGSFSFITDALTAASHEFRLMYRGDNTAGHTFKIYANTDNPLRFAVHELPS